MKNEKIKNSLSKSDSTKKKIPIIFWILMVLGVVVVIVGLLLNYFLFSGKGETEGVKNLPEEVTSSIIGNYEFIQDSDGSTPNKEAEITLSLSGDGFAHLSAVQPEERMESYGRYKIESDKIDITFYSLDKKAKKASYDFDGDNLTLPILIINDGEGSSEWKKITVGNPIEGGQIYLEYLLSQGKGQEESAKKVMEYVKSHDNIRDIYATDDWKSITIDYDSDSNIKFFISSELNHPPILDFDCQEKEKTETNNILDKVTPKANAQWASPIGPMLPFMALSHSEILDLRFKSWLENEPEPIQNFDAPLAKKAVVILHPAYYQDFKKVEEDVKESGVLKQPLLYAPAIYLEDAGYEVTSEGWFNTLELKDYIRIFTTDYGVIYWSTHGGVTEKKNGTETVWLSLGPSRIGKLGDPDQEIDNKYVDYIKEQCKDTGYDWLVDFDANDCFTVSDKGILYVNAKFIEKLDNDYSDGLIFIKACHSLWDMSFKDAFNAKAFLGFTNSISTWVANMLSHDFFLNLSKKTRTAREAYDFSWGYVRHKTNSFPSTHKKFADKTLDCYKLYISGDDSPQLCGANGNFEGLSSPVHAMLVYARIFAVRDPDKSLEGEIEQLMTCYEKYWSSGESVNRLKDIYCHDCASGGIPTIEDVKNAQGILRRYEDGRERFTLIE